MEALAFESLWLPDHAVVPVQTTTPWPESQPGRGEIPEVYSHMCDPFVAMSMAAAVTTRLTVAIGVCLIPERNPLVTAKEIATLDFFSHGRLVLGIGASWLKKESEILGADFPHRWTQTCEYIAAMRQLWTHEQAAFAGKYVNFPPVRSYSKAGAQRWSTGADRQQGQKRSALGGAVGRRWCPIFFSPTELRDDLNKLREECDRAGRNYGQLDITIMKRGLRGDRAKVAKRAARKSGCWHGALRPRAHRHADDASKYESQLEELASLYI